MTKAIRVDNDSRKDFRGKAWWTPTSGTRLPAGERALGLRAHALLLVCPTTAVLSERTAAALWDAPLPNVLSLDELHVTLPLGGFHVTRPGVICHRRHLTSDEIGEVHGLRVTSPERTFTDLAGTLSLARLVAVGDDLLHRSLMTEERLAHVLKDSRKQRGIRRARQAAALLDARAESPRESITRILLIEAGLPCPCVNRNIFDGDGKFIARGDLVYEEWKIVIEYDGEHHLSREQQAKDADRRHRLALAGWLVVTVVPDDLARPYLLARKVHEAIQLRLTGSRRLPCA